MRDIHDHNEYHKYESITKGSNNVVGSGVGKPSLGGWIVIIIVIIMLIHFIFNDASWDAIDTLLGLGFLAFLFINWMTK